MGDAHRRQPQSYLIDPRFQLKWTSYLVVVVLAVMAALGVVIARISERAAVSASVAVEQATRAAAESKANSVLARQSVMIAAPEMAHVMDEALAEEDRKATENLAKIELRQREIAENQRTLKTLLLGSGVVLVVVLVLMGIFITHRIVGPVHKMKLLLRRVSTGRLFVGERLRKGDELEDLFDTFLQMTYSLSAMQRARLATLDGTLRKAEASGAPEEVLDGLRALKAQMVVGLAPRRPSIVSESER